ncbi:hypothetical protein EJ04DRAFT_436920, partial [Polyplosphaeria fusca]
KRKRAFTRRRYEICEQCDLEYDVTTNTDASCLWHFGKLKIDYGGDFWDAHDEDRDGIIDSEEIRDKYPQGFDWSCCYKNGKTAGRIVGKHRPDETKRGCSGSGVESAGAVKDRDVMSIAALT